MIRHTTEDTMEGVHPFLLIHLRLIYYFNLVFQLEFVLIKIVEDYLLIVKTIANSSRDFICNELTITRTGILVGYR